jgi:hypothetical protein
LEGCLYPHAEGDYYFHQIVRVPIPAWRRPRVQ